ncbi:hypothetical protein PR202_gn00343 [Eleusine coracana subsp. coracana]|uniref:H(+)/Pi cotransporter n=1 Tax=Eleusine coracana subsp. coracana TaxID=191504 RepID=A0AAV5G2Z6_ELECO|nr:hypothetical protein PR202_gn00343 [Eleusine coracana subsp. coracana]
MADTATAPLLTSHKSTKPAKAPSIDDMIETYMGATGSVQLLKAILVGFAWAFDAQQVFIEWALNCGGPAFVSLPASSFFAGCLVGGFLLTTLADSVLGRKKMLLVSLVSMSVTGVLTAFAPNVWVYAVLRFMAGFARSMIGTCTLVLSTEIVGKKWRNVVSLAAFFCYTFGFLSLPVLGYTFRQASWRNMYIWTSVPCLFYTMLLYFLVQESPRWLLVRGRKKEAIDTLQQIASLNGGKSTETSFSLPEMFTLPEDAGTSSSDIFATLQTMWERRWALQRLAAIMTAGYGVGMVYFGMPLNVGSLGSNLYLSVAYNALAELPSNILLMFLMARINRRSSVVAFSVAASACSLACVAIPQSAAAARMAAELVSFVATCTAYNIILMYSIELFPTSVRSSAVGLLRQAMVLGGVAAPVLVALGRERSFWSFGVFGLVIGSSGLFAACLPETRGRTMSDTMEEEEERHEAAIVSCTGALSAVVSKNSDYNLV